MNDCEVTVLPKEIRFEALWPIYTKHQHQCSANARMTLAILFSLKSMETLGNGIATRFRATPFVSMRIDAQCKWALISLSKRYVNGNGFRNVYKVVRSSRFVLLHTALKDPWNH